MHQLHTRKLRVLKLSRFELTHGSSCFFTWRSFGLIFWTWKTVRFLFVQLMRKIFKKINKNFAVMACSSFSDHSPETLTIWQEKYRSNQNPWITLTKVIHDNIQRQERSILPIQFMRNHHASRCDRRRSLLVQRQGKRQMVWDRRW